MAKMPVWHKLCNIFSVVNGNESKESESKETILYQNNEGKLVFKGDDFFLQQRPWRGMQMKTKIITAAIGLLSLVGCGEQFQADYEGQAVVRSTSCALGQRGDQFDMSVSMRQSGNNVSVLVTRMDALNATSGRDASELIFGQQFQAKLDGNNRFYTDDPEYQISDAEARRLQAQLDDADIILSQEELDALPFRTVDMSGDLASGKDVINTLRIEMDAKVPNTSTNRLEDCRVIVETDSNGLSIVR